MSSNQQLNDAWDCAVFAQWGVIGWTECQVADESNNGLDEWPLAWRVQQFHNNRQSIMQPHSILGCLGLSVTARQVTKCANLTNKKNNAHE